MCLLILCVYMFLQADQPWTRQERGLLLTGLTVTTDSILTEIKDLSEDQWQFQESNKRWSIQYIVEHIFLQSQAYYRELNALSASPARMDLTTLRENDQIFIDYATDPTPGTADWDVEPSGRFCTLDATIAAFKRLREEMQKLIRSTNADFRHIFTYRNIPENVIRKNPKFYNARLRRDLHQLILNDIAHSKRHLRQIRNVKSNPGYPGAEDN